MEKVITEVMQGAADCALRGEGLKLRRKRGVKRDRFGMAISLLVQTELAKHGKHNEAAMVELIRELA